MTTRQFIHTFCKGGHCPHFDPNNLGCQAYFSEECDPAFGHPLYRGLTMRQRITDFCESHYHPPSPTHSPKSSI